MEWNWQHKDWPHFNYDAVKIEDLEQSFLFNAAKTQWLWEHIDESEKQDLSINFLANEALKTSEIEWEILSRDSVRSSIQKYFWIKNNFPAKPSEIWIAQMMVHMFQNSDQQIDHEILFQWHKYVCNGRTDLEDIWKYRTHIEKMQVVSGQIDNLKIHYEAPASKDIPKEMEIFINWLKNNKDSPLIRSSIAHLYFVCIHPFEDENGRIGRSISEHILSNYLGYPSLIALSHMIEKYKNIYYQMLEKNNTKIHIDSWIVWFAQTIIEAQEYSMKTIHFIIKKTKIYDSFRDDLNSRQLKVLNKLFDAWIEGFVWWLSAKNYMSISQTTISTTTRDLNDLVNKWILKKTWERKSTRYFLNI